MIFSERHVVPHKLSCPWTFREPVGLGFTKSFCIPVFIIITFSPFTNNIVKKRSNDDRVRCQRYPIASLKTSLHMVLEAPTDGPNRRLVFQVVGVHAIGLVRPTPSYSGIHGWCTVPYESLIRSVVTEILCGMCRAMGLEVTILLAGRSNNM